MANVASVHYGLLLRKSAELAALVERMNCDLITY